MIDPTTLPILLKAIDFVFDEGRKILEERRERRKNDDSAPVPENPEPDKEVSPAKTQATGETKQDLLSSKIDEILWQNYEWEVGSLVRRLEKETKSYYIRKEQYAQLGSAFAPPYIILEIEEREKSMIETIKELETVLSKVYKKDIDPI